MAWKKIKIKNRTYDSEGWGTRLVTNVLVMFWSPQCFRASSTAWKWYEWVATNCGRVATNCGRFRTPCDFQHHVLSKTICLWTSCTFQHHVFFPTSCFFSNAVYFPNTACWCVFSTPCGVQYHVLNTTVCPTTCVWQHHVFSNIRHNPVVSQHDVFFNTLRFSTPCVVQHHAFSKPHECFHMYVFSNSTSCDTTSCDTTSFVQHRTKQAFFQHHVLSKPSTCFPTPYPFQ